MYSTVTKEMATQTDHVAALRGVYSVLEAAIGCVMNVKAFSLLYVLYHKCTVVLPANRDPREPTTLAVIPSPTHLGCIIAPQGMNPDAILFERPLGSLRPGRRGIICFLSSPDVPRPSYDVEAGLAALCSQLHVSAILETPGGDASVYDSSILDAGISVDVLHQRVVVDVALQDGVPAGSYVTLKKVLYAGRPLAVASTTCAIPVRRGMTAPLALKLDGDASSFGGGHTPSFLADGSLFVPRSGYDVAVFGPGGEPLPTLVLADLGLTRSTAASAATQLVDAAGATTSALILADYGSGTVIAADPNACRSLWSTARGAAAHCLGVASLPAAGSVAEAGNVVVAGSYNSTCLHVLRTSDGACLSSVPTGRPPMYLASYVAPASSGGDSRSQLFASLHGDNQGIWQFYWTGGALCDASPVVGSAGCHSVAVVPGRRSGKAAGIEVPTVQSTAHLVCAKFGTPVLLVFSLPDLALVHSHTLDGVGVWGLAADPWGDVLAVSDSQSKAVRILAWPLPGMSGSEKST